MTDAATRAELRGRLGDSISRPDAVPKVQGTFAFSGDLSADGFLWGATLRSPHPHARIVRIDLSAAWKISGVEAIVTAADVPGKPTYGLISDDQPVFAADVVRYVGDRSWRPPITGDVWRALAAIVVEYQVLAPLSILSAVDGSHVPSILTATSFVISIVRDQTIQGPVVVEGTE